MKRHLPSSHSTASRGFTLLLSVLVASIVLAIGLSILNITLKEFTLSRIARESVIALNAADAGMECIRYWDISSQGDRFDVGSAPSSISCMGSDGGLLAGGAGSGGVINQTFAFTWGSPQVCAKVQIKKYYSLTSTLPMDFGSCPMGAECTTVIARGYNKACSDLTSGGTVERALRTRY